MRPLFLTAVAAVSAMGRGRDATLAALCNRRSALAPCDFAALRLPGHIGRVAGIEDHALPPGLAGFDCRNNRLADIALRCDGFAEAVADARARHGAGRVAVVVGTSTSGILSSEDAYRRRDPATGALPEDFDYARTHDLFSLARFVRAALGLRGPALTLSCACASSARSFIDARALIESGVCDAAVVGGADSLCRMTLHGFASLGLISPDPCRPCDAARSGISIGEAAGFALIERAEVAGGTGVALLGGGATSDGYHMSAPDPTGTGAAGAMRQALESAGLEAEAVDYVNLHGTGTRANDAMEDAAVVAVFGTETPCSSTKAWSGHTLGASGILEAAIAVLCIRHGLMPGCLGAAEPDPAFRSRILLDNMAAPVRRVMSNAFGFGGINCSLLFGRAEAAR
ncbi:MAG TPA: beta-ketoacyl-[acyl-carrier-protein] synthase family protein [Acetobacteraceae bacterium]|nr:beta-ketoacyl-[acyl-carrier-protein] synthase family protein [Acetobacteraceae bacterium]